jgi:polar amino acid transport system substrate-binding protein
VGSRDPTRRACLLALAAGAATWNSRAIADSPALRIGYPEFGPPWSFRTGEGRMTGTMVDAVACIARLAGIEVSHAGYPWVRTQAMVQSGDLDGFCTIPTPEREAYAAFTTTPIIIEPSVIVYRVEDKRPATIRTKEDMAALTQGSYLGNGWGKETLKDFKITWVINEVTCFRMLVEGRFDIIVAGEIGAPYLIRALGLGALLRTTPAPFMPERPKCLAVRRSYPDCDGIVARLEDAVVAGHRSREIDRIFASTL